MSNLNLTPNQIDTDNQAEALEAELNAVQQKLAAFRETRMGNADLRAANFTLLDAINKVTDFRVQNLKTK